MRRAHLGETQNHMQPTNEMLEDENTSMEMNLSNKVKALKHLSIDIGTEVKIHNNLLDDMDTDFDSSSGLLSSSMARVKAIARSGGWKHIFYLILFGFFVFFICYMIIKFRQPDGESYPGHCTDDDCLSFTHIGYQSGRTTSSYVHSGIRRFCALFAEKYRNIESKYQDNSPCDHELMANVDISQPIMILYHTCRMCPKISQYEMLIPR